MDIQTLSVNMNQTYVQEEAAVKVQAMAMQNIKTASEGLDRLMDSAKVFTDPNAGNYLNMFM